VAELIESQTFRSLAYVLACVCCALVAVSWGRQRSFSWSGLYWAGAACLLLSFALLKLGGVEQVVQQTGREFADRGGIYDVRRSYQAALVLAIAVSGVVWLAGFIIALRQEKLWRLLPGLVAVTSLGCYVLVRAVSYHNLDTVLYRRASLGVQNSALIEVTLIALVIGVTLHAFQVGPAPSS
jgi:hypothetical protein